MKTIDTYLTIILSLMIFYYILMLYLKHVYKPSQSNFTPVVPDKINEFNPEPNLYLTEDTRTTYKTLPPVNPMVLNAQIKTDKPSSGLFTNQSSNTNYYMLDQPKDANLLFDDKQIISIPLQYNYPYNEQLRSQQVLITPYNKIKYGNC